MNKNLNLSLISGYSGLSSKAADRFRANVARFPLVFSRVNQGEFCKTLSRKHNGAECSSSIELGMPILERWAKAYQKTLPKEVQTLVNSHVLDGKGNLWTGAMMSLCGRGAGFHSTGKSELTELLGKEAASQVSKAGMLGESKGMAAALVAVDSVLLAREKRANKRKARKANPKAPRTRPILTIDAAQENLPPNVDKEAVS